MKQNKLNALLLSGLIIGPVLGSGIIILPPVVYGISGNWSFFAWIIMVLVSFLFAGIFGFLSIKFPGDAGVSNAAKHVFDEDMKKLTSFYLIGAVFFGPVAVLITAGEYFSTLFSGVHPYLAGVLILVFCFFILTREVSFIGKASFILSTVAAGVLLLGGISTILFSRKDSLVIPPFEPSIFGYSLLLLFWTIVGWEIIGNYSMDVRDPEKTIRKAVIISVSVIATVTLSVSAAIQWISPDILNGRPLSVSVLLSTMFGSTGEYFVSALVVALCVTTYLLFVGGVARLMNSLGSDRILPGFLSFKLKNQSPVSALTVLCSAHLLFLYLAARGFFDVKSLIALADGFFISNALIGIICAYKLMKNRVLKILTGLLILFFVVILLFSEKMVLSVLFLMALVVNRKKLRLTVKKR